MNIHIETDRLIIRDFVKENVQGIFELDSNPAVHTFLGNKPIHTMEQAEQIVDYIMGQYETYGMGRWAIIDKENGEFVGWTGLKYEDKVRKEFNYYDIGYRLKENYWGKGIATETAIASLKYGFETMNLSEIGGAADVNHAASNKILRKIGLQFVDTFEYEGAAHNWYNLTKSSYLEKIA